MLGIGNVGSRGSVMAERMRVAAVVLVCGVLVAAAGCGTSDYNSLMKRGIAGLRGEVKFKGLYGESEIPGSPFSVRIPMIFTNSYREDSAHDDDGERIKADRVQPPFLPLRGLKLCYESTAKDDAGQKLPYYCYIAVMPSQPGDADRVAGEIEAKLKQQFPGGEIAWEPIDADAPSGLAVHWRKIRATGAQPFLVKVGGQVQTQELPGIFELWMHDADDQLVLIGWRSPESINVPFTEEIQVVAGIPVPPSNVKPDLDKWPVLTAGSLTKTAAAPE